jgi:hypothetical protein
MGRGSNNYRQALLLGRDRAGTTRVRLSKHEQATTHLAEAIAAHEAAGGK